MEAGMAAGRIHGKSLPEFAAAALGKGPGKGGKSQNEEGKGKRGKGKGKKDDLEVVVKGFPSTTDEATLQAYFSSCGEITRVSIPRAKDGFAQRGSFCGFHQPGRSEQCADLGQVPLHGQRLHLRPPCWREA